MKTSRISITKESLDYLFSIITGEKIEFKSITEHFETDSYEIVLNGCGVDVSDPELAPLVKIDSIKLKEVINELSKKEDDFSNINIHNIYLEDDEKVDTAG